MLTITLLSAVTRCSAVIASDDEVEESPCT